MREYKALTQQTYKNGEFEIVPIRQEDRFEIMKWRNEQIYHLRQSEPLTVEKQDKYFNTTIAPLFYEEKPNQILFSFLEGNECIGYGGLVHINWIDRNAEVSFIMNTRLEETSFSENWSIFLKCLEQLAFSELEFHKIFIYAFDLRPHLYDVLELNGYFKDARLKDHCFFQGDFKDVLIYSKLMNQ
jgi:RimJ/RimL family protein N-acetyltransferase